jgi:hypothetical protein
MRSRINRGTRRTPRIGIGAPRTASGAKSRFRENSERLLGRLQAENAQLRYAAVELALEIQNLRQLKR